MNWTIILTKMLTETLLYRTITMDTALMDTITDSQTPSLDGGLVHFSGPRLIGYDQLSLSPIVVTPTKVFLQNRHPLSSSSIYSNREQRPIRKVNPTGDT